MTFSLIGENRFYQLVDNENKFVSRSGFINKISSMGLDIEDYYPYFILDEKIPFIIDRFTGVFLVPQKFYVEGLEDKIVQSKYDNCKSFSFEYIGDFNSLCSPSYTVNEFSRGIYLEDKESLDSGRYLIIDKKFEDTFLIEIYKRRLWEDFYELYVAYPECRTEFLKSPTLLRLNNFYKMIIDEKKEKGRN